MIAVATTLHMGYSDQMTDSCDGPDVAAFRSFMSAHTLLVSAIERAFAAGGAASPRPGTTFWPRWRARLRAMLRIHALADEIVLSRSGAQPPDRPDRGRRADAPRALPGATGAGRVCGDHRRGPRGPRTDAARSTGTRSRSTSCRISASEAGSVREALEHGSSTRPGVQARPRPKPSRPPSVLPVSSGAIVSPASLSCSQ